jgi:hypothetical protein
VWVIVFWIVGIFLFNNAYHLGDLTPANKSNGVQPPFQPALYTLDLLLPVVNLHIRDA